MKTLENILVQRNHPLIRAGPEGYHVEIDGTSIRRKRQELRLPLQEQAEVGPPFMGIAMKTTSYVDTVAPRVTYSPPTSEDPVILEKAWPIKRSQAKKTKHDSLNIAQSLL